MLITPIEESVVYFQPIYLQDQQNPLPEYRRVVVVYGDQVVMRPGLAEALAVVFGGSETPTEPGGEEEQPPPLESDVLELLEEAERLFELADEALQRGDLGEYQQLIDEARASSARQPTKAVRRQRRPSRAMFGGRNSRPTPSDLPR